jgi:hypothetical protein
LFTSLAGDDWHMNASQSRTSTAGIAAAARHGRYLAGRSREPRPARRSARRSSRVDQRSLALAALRNSYDRQARRIDSSLRELFQRLAEPGAAGDARQSFAEVDASIESAVRTVVRALDLLPDESRARRRRRRKEAGDERKLTRFWSRQLNRLLELQTQVSWLALDTPRASPSGAEPPPRWFVPALPKRPPTTSAKPLTVVRPATTSDRSLVGAR